MNEGNPRGRRMLDPTGRGMQRNQYGNHVPGPIPSIGNQTEEAGKKRSRRSIQFIFFFAFNRDHQGFRIG